MRAALAQLVRLGWFRLLHKQRTVAADPDASPQSQSSAWQAAGYQNSVRGSLNVFGLKLGQVAKQLLRGTRR
jgi:hypothetical protein